MADNRRDTNDPGANVGHDDPVTGARLDKRADATEYGGAAEGTGLSAAAAAGAGVDSDPNLGTDFSGSADEPNTGSAGQIGDEGTSYVTEGGLTGRSHATSAGGQGGTGTDANPGGMRDMGAGAGSSPNITQGTTDSETGS